MMMTWLPGLGGDRVLGGVYFLVSRRANAGPLTNLLYLHIASSIAPPLSWTRDAQNTVACPGQLIGPLGQQDSGIPHIGKS